MDAQSDLLAAISQDIFLLEDLAKHQKIFDLLPIAIYWKNKDGKYCGRNRFAAEDMIFLELEPDLNAIPNVISDHDVFNKQTADMFYENDLQTLKNPSSLQHFIEPIVLPSGDSLDQISLKRCVLDEDFQPIGILGCTINISKLTNPNKPLVEVIKASTVTKLHQLIMRFMSSSNTNLYTVLVDKLMFLLPLYPFNTESQKLLSLTNRELQCLCLLLKGYSARIIAGVMSISFRTVEIYLKRIQEKLDVHSKLEAANWFWDLLSRL